jgi:hypothetical protein
VLVSLSFFFFFLIPFLCAHFFLAQRVTVLVDSNGVRHPPQLGVSDYDQTNANSIIAQGVLVLRCVDQQQLADNAARNSGQSLYVLRHGREGQSAAQHCAELLALIARQPAQFSRNGELVRALLIISDGGPYVACVCCVYFFVLFFLLRFCFYVCVCSLRTAQVRSADPPRLACVLRVCALAAVAARAHRHHIRRRELVLVAGRAATRRVWPRCCRLPNWPRRRARQSVG